MKKLFQILNLFMKINLFSLNFVKIVMINQRGKKIRE